MAKRKDDDRRFLLEAEPLEDCPGAILYKRPNAKTGKPGKRWYVGITVQEEGNTRKTWVPKSTRETHRAAAIKRAKTLYVQIVNRADSAEPIREIKFSQAAREYLGLLRTRNANRDGVSDEKLRRCERLVRLHLMQDPIWNRRLRHIRAPDIEDYLSRRISRHSGRKALRVSNNTLNIESTHLRAIFRYAVDKGYVSVAPKIPNRGSKWENINARPTFTKREWEILTGYMREWVKTAPKTHPYARAYREIMRDFVQVMGYSGLRPNEARLLKWKDITIEEGRPTDAYPDGDHSVFLQVENPKANTPKREAVALPWAKTTLERRYRLPVYGHRSLPCLISL